MNVNITSTGLKEFRQICRAFPVKLQTELVKATEVVGALLLASVRQRFMEQGPGWSPLSAEYAKWKTESGFDPRILFRFYRLFSAIRFQRKGISSGEINVAPGSYTGVAREVSPSKRGSFKRFSGFKLRSERKTFAEVAAIHENGSRPRPFFAPTVKIEELRVKLIYRRALANALKL